MIADALSGLRGTSISTRGDAGAIQPITTPASTRCVYAAPENDAAHFELLGAEDPNSSAGNAFEEITRVKSRCVEFISALHFLSSNCEHLVPKVVRNENGEDSFSEGL